MAGYIASIISQFSCPVIILISSTKSNSLTAFQRALATILQREFGSCEFVHYALRCEKGQVTNIRRQQQELSEKLVNSVEVLLGSKSSVLLCGPSFSHATERLLNRAHRVEWLNSQPEIECQKKTVTNAFPFLSLPFFVRFPSFLRFCAT